MTSHLMKPIFLALASVCALALPAKRAQAYQVDCAILICLSGGWPASAECTHARSVFIQRITPWPVEPPLQIWRCPMRGAMNNLPESTPSERLYKFAFVEQSMGLPMSSGEYAAHAETASPATVPAVLYTENQLGVSAAAEIVKTFALQISTGSQGADIDISDPAFNFVRSLRVYHMEFRQSKGRDQCRRSDASRLGVYGPQGEYAWRGHTLRTVTRVRTGSGGRDGAIYTEVVNWNAPVQSAIHQSPSGGNCPNISFRAVGVYWEDYEGNPGYEEVKY